MIDYIYPSRTMQDGWYEHIFLTTEYSPKFEMDLRQWLGIHCKDEWDYNVGRRKAPWVAEIKIWLKCPKDFIICKLRW